MKVKAIRNDSWLGIKKNKLYDTKLVKGHLMVHTDGYIIPFKESDFVLVDKNPHKEIITDSQGNELL